MQAVGRERPFDEDRPESSEGYHVTWSVPDRDRPILVKGQEGPKLPPCGPDIPKRRERTYPPFRLVNGGRYWT